MDIWTVTRTTWFARAQMTQGYSFTKPEAALREDYRHQKQQHKTSSLNGILSLYASLLAKSVFHAPISLDMIGFTHPQRSA
ncbi:hypothetical protein MPTK1_1g19800 [Marchantia polymorpha subsp. ruderalis]|uniref:Uncharacterized protein n=2 Tax=Marchantia polymorpha TaxID=3197 RepID=A0AAF6AS20_MARPO|nr:hypothetical protein MARPO_0001s0319 [Marchantia polymorpha]BBM99240.1 hypothetical protein Mp_1g19800 [Marchantia polymorpha subsp. ruderalis]|eukprot:PTQ50323.1 hypothetical protein MARPO_0001s0319 [Marchantia polymorpha]